MPTGKLVFRKGSLGKDAFGLIEPDDGTDTVLFLAAGLEGTQLDALRIDDKLEFELAGLAAISLASAPTGGTPIFQGTVRSLPDSNFEGIIKPSNSAHRKLVIFPSNAVRPGTPSLRVNDVVSYRLVTGSNPDDDVVDLAQEVWRQGGGGAEVEMRMVRVANGIRKID